MATARAPSSGLDSILNIASTLLPMFTGSGKTTTKSSPDVDANALAQQNRIISQALANSNDPAQTKAIVDEIFRNGAIAFAPQIGNQASSGMYNTSTLQLLRDNAYATSTGAASKAVLDYKTQQAQIANQGVGNILQATRGATTTAQTGPSVNPLIPGIAGAGLLAYSKGGSILNALGLGGTSASEAAHASDLGNLFGAHASIDDMFNTGDLLNLGGSEGGGGDLLSFLGGGGEDVASSLFDGGGGGLADLIGGGGIEDIGSSLLSDGASSLVGEGLSDAIPFFGWAHAANSVLESVGVDIPGVSDAFDFIDNKIINPVIGGISDVVSSVFGGSIICTWLMQQGYISRRDWARTMRHFQTYSNEAREAYYVWANPTLEYCKRKPSSLFARFITWTFINRTNYICGRRRLSSILCYTGISTTCVTVGWLYVMPRKWLAAKKLFGVSYGH